MVLFFGKRPENKRPYHSDFFKANFQIQQVARTLLPIIAFWEARAIRISFTLDFRINMRVKFLAAFGI
jgi:hypothetical protein